MKNIELLAPAGDIEKLKMAIVYGADAVYLAGESFGLRKASKNFTNEQLKEATDFVHKNGKKIYITLNIIPHNDDLVGLEDYVQTLVEIGVDALIVADAGIYSTVRSVSKEIEVHLSTQASVTNYKTVKFWRDLGVKRIVLARELSLEEINLIHNKVPDVDIEVFVHGAMCISYSGRCLLSNYMCSRDANKGDCAHACRWKYNLVEEKRPGEYYPIEETSQGTFIYNSKDLCMLDSLTDVINAGVHSFKIEGRVKTQYYVATVIRSYRLILDAIENGTYTKEMAQRLLLEIKKASHRDFTKGFYYKKPDETDQLYNSSSYIRNYDFVGLVLDYDKNTKIATIEQRNRIFVGDEVEIFGPRDGFETFKIEKMYDDNDKEISVAPRAKQIIKMPLPFEVKPWDIMRKKLDESN